IKKLWPEISATIKMPTSQRDYSQLCQVLDELVDEVGERTRHPLAPLLDTLGTLLAAYENDHVPVATLRGVELLKYLMQEHGLTQKDLKEVASQGVLSEILRNKRALNVRQIKALAARFHVSPAVFLD